MLIGNCLNHLFQINYYDHHYHCMIFTLGQYTVPSVSGQCCPPSDDFIIEKVNHNKGIMFGGLVTAGDGMTTSTNSVYIFNVTHNTIVSYSITLSQYYYIYCIVYSLILITCMDDLTHRKLSFNLVLGEC